MVAVLMADFAAVAYYQVRMSISTIYKERYDMLRTQAESGLSILQLYHGREKASELSHEEAQRQACAIAAAIKFEPAGYLWAFDSDVTVRFHYNAPLVGMNFKGQPDKKGNLFRDASRRGHHLYYCEKPGEPAGEFLEKATYSRIFDALADRRRDGRLYRRSGGGNQQDDPAKSPPPVSSPSSFRLRPHSS